MTEEQKDVVIKDLTLIILRWAKHVPEDKVQEVYRYLHRKGLTSPLRINA